MSKISELLEAQNGYEAASAAIERTKPKAIQIAITYDFIDPRTKEKKTVQAGNIGYVPSSNTAWISISDNRTQRKEEIQFDATAIPALIKAFQELAE